MEPPRRTRWLFGWGALLLLYGIVEFAAFRGVGEFLDSTPLSERGLVCLTMEGAMLDRLKLPMMVDHNTSVHTTAFRP